MQEILVVVAIALVVIFIPRLMNRKSAPEAEPQARLQSRPRVQSNNFVTKIVLTGWMRLLIVITFLWIAGSAACLKPWEGKPLLFICLSLGPTVVVWGGIWAWAGYKKYRR